MDGIHTLLVPHRRLKYIPRRKGKDRLDDTGGAVEYFTDWMTSFSDEWKRKPAEKEEVKIFLENNMGIDKLYVQNLLEG